MPQKLKTENINSSFFHGYYKEIWRQIFPEKTTVAEAEFIITEAGLKDGSNVLDIMCGYGRHGVELAKRGIHVTAVDNLPDYINEIKEIALAENLPIEGLTADVLEVQLVEKYDAAICMGNSLQFFDYVDTLKLLSNISDHMKPGSLLIINTWSIAEIVFKSFKEKTWGKVNDLLFLTDSRLLFQPTRIETDSIIITDAGEREEKKGIDYIFSIAELEFMFNKTEFILKEIYSIPGKRKFTAGEPRAYIVAEKI